MRIQCERCEKLYILKWGPYESDHTDPVSKLVVLILLVVSRGREYILFIFVERKQRKLKEIKIVVIVYFFFLKCTIAYSHKQEIRTMLPFLVRLFSYVENTSCSLICCFLYPCASSLLFDRLLHQLKFIIFADSLIIRIPKYETEVLIPITSGLTVCVM